MYAKRKSKSLEGKHEEQRAPPRAKSPALLRVNCKVEVSMTAPQNGKDHFQNTRTQAEKLFETLFLMLKRRKGNPAWDIFESSKTDTQAT